MVDRTAVAEGRAGAGAGRRKRIGIPRCWEFEIYWNDPPVSRVVIGMAPYLGDNPKSGIATHASGKLIRMIDAVLLVFP